MPQPGPERLAFDDVVIDFVAHRLTRGGVEQLLEPKAFAVLALLVGAPGKVFTREEILDAIWGHQHVTPSVLNRIMSLLRQALGEDAQNPRVLHTVHGVGYRFELPTTAAVASPPPSPPMPRWLWPAVIVAAVLLPIAGAIWLRSNVGAPTSMPVGAAASRTLPSLAVLPFVDLSQAHDQEYLADGLAEEILNQLAQVPALRVVGRSSSFSFRGKNEDLRLIGKQLGVAHLLEGSVREAGSATKLSMSSSGARSRPILSLWNWKSG